jgi:hypothetical protein
MRAILVLFVIVPLAGFVQGGFAQDNDGPPVLHRGSPDGSKSSGKNPKDSSETARPVVTGVGIVHRIDDKSIQIEADDTRLITCAITARTEFRGPDGKINAEDVGPGARVRITANAIDDEMNLAATSVVVERSTEKPVERASRGSAAESAPESAPENAAPEKTATIVNAPLDDDDRPVLKRGIPTKKRNADDDDDADTASATAPAAPTRSAAPGKSSASSQSAVASPPEEPSTLTGPPRPVLIEKARETNQDFIEHLPNFVCQQFTTRYARQMRGEGFKPLDVISATVTYVDGKEQYQNIKVGNRSVNQDMMAIKGGARSIGEFGSVLQGLLSVQSDGEFRYVRDEDIHHVRAKVYDFTVRHGNSDWGIGLGGQEIVPGYSGRVWIERDSARVLRIERQAQDIPESFPIDHVEQTVDYDYVMIAAKKLLLPTQSENLACQRGSAYCSKNVIEFRNYREFRGEATIEYEK